MTIWWLMMRQAAVHRHWWFNMTFEGGCPVKWRRHLDVIRRVYGW